MKRGNEESENEGLKKGRFSGEIDGDCGVEGAGEGGNGVGDSAPVADDGGFSGMYDFGGPSFSYMEEGNKWDDHLNFGSIFMYEEEQQSLGFDLNVPVFGNTDVGGENGFQGCSQGGNVDSQNNVEVIDITSDDSDGDVEIIGYNIGNEGKGKDVVQNEVEIAGYDTSYREKGKEIVQDEVEIVGYGTSYREKGKEIVQDEVEIVGYGTSYREKGKEIVQDEVETVGYDEYYRLKGKGIAIEMPSDGMENLNLGLGLFIADNAVGETSYVDDGERRYTREEKGKDSIFSDPWLSLKPDYLMDWEFLSESYGPIQINDNEPLEEVEITVWHPAPLPSRPELDERAHREVEQVMRRREAMHRQTLRETARRFARVSTPVVNNGNGPLNQKVISPTLSSADQLGKSPGPFSEALKMIRERASKRVAKQLIEWKPSEGKQGHSVTAPLVPSLLELSVKALARNAQGIVSLELVPDILRRKLTDVICDMNEMNIHFLNHLVKGCPTEIRVKNCAWLTEKQFQQTFGDCQTNNLRVLQLDLCGQCMLDIAFRDILARSPNSFSSLAIVSLRGSCRLSDGGVRELVKAAPALRSINLGHCNLLTCHAINFIADYLGVNLRELYIDECQKINVMLILPAFQKFKHLEVLSAAGMLSVTDKFICDMVTFCSRSIKELDLSDCQELTDWSLKTIGSSCANLCSLNISNLNNLTDLTLEYLANGCRSIQKLKLSRNRFSDEAVGAFLDTSGESLVELLLNSVAKVGPNTAFSLARRSRKLLHLDISWCRRITNEALGLVVDSCSSLKVLKVFGCKQITSVFLNGHSNPIVRIIGLNLSPILDHVNLLEPEEVLLRYSPLPVAAEA